MVVALVETGHRAQNLRPAMFTDATRAPRPCAQRPASITTGLARLVVTQPEPPR